MVSQKYHKLNSFAHQIILQVQKTPFFSKMAENDRYWGNYGDAGWIKWVGIELLHGGLP